MATFDLKSYARRGAEVRLMELREELEAIFAAFPDLRGPRTDRSAAPTRRRRRKMTAAQRKAVGERMRKYWAARKKAAKS